MCNEKETYTGKTKRDKTKGFKVTINQRISDCKRGDTICKFPYHVHDCVIKNNCLEESFFSLNIMLRLNESSVSLKENSLDSCKHTDEKF